MVSALSKSYRYNVTEYALDPQIFLSIRCFPSLWKSSKNFFFFFFPLLLLSFREFASRFVDCDDNSDVYYPGTYLIIIYTLYVIG